jgi:hypothetical protein
MNMKSIAILFGACLVVGSYGCVVTTGGSGGAGGNGGAGVGGGTTTTTMGTGGTGGGTTTTDTGTTTTTGTSTCTVMCVSCAEEATPGANPCNLPTCTGTSTDLYNALVDCTCNGACKAACGDNACANPPKDITAECTTCIQDTQMGCGMAFQECANDAG